MLNICWTAFCDWYLSSFYRKFSAWTKIVFYRLVGRLFSCPIRTNQMAVAYCLGLISNFGQDTRHHKFDPPQPWCLFRFLTSVCIIRTGTCWIMHSQRIFHGAQSAFFYKASFEPDPSCLKSNALPTELSLPVFVGTFQNCSLYVHITYVFGNINSVPTLLKVFACAEHFAIGKSRQYYSKISSFCHYNLKPLVPLCCHSQNLECIPPNNYVWPVIAIS